MRRSEQPLGCHDDPKHHAQHRQCSCVLPREIALVGSPFQMVGGRYALHIVGKSPFASSQWRNSSQKVTLVCDAVASLHLSTEHGNPRGPKCSCAPLSVRAKMSTMVCTSPQARPMSQTRIHCAMQRECKSSWCCADVQYEIVRAVSSQIGRSSGVAHNIPQK